MIIRASSPIRSVGFASVLGWTLIPVAVQAANVFYGTNPGALQFTDGANWTGGVVPTSTDVAVIDSVDGITNYPYIDSTIEFQRFSIAAVDSSTMGGLEFRSGANVTTTVDSAHYVGARGTGYVRILDGATLEIGGPMIVGWANTGVGTLTMSGGTVTMLDYLQVARQGNGSFIQSGGDLSIFRGASNAMVVGPFAGATGYYEISGGSLSINVLTAPGGLTNGAVDGGGGATATIKIVGDAPTVTVNGDYSQYPGGSLALDIGTGISPMNVAGNVAITGGDLDVNFTATPSVGQQFTIVNYGNLAGTFATFDTLVDSPMGANSVNLSIDYGTGAGSAIVLTVDSLVASHPGDFNGDGSVDGADFVAWQTNFPTASGATLGQGDANGDGAVDGADFVIWQTHFPYTPGPGTMPVPEPTAILLASLGGILAFILRRRATC
ncbi:MAG: PEP-CTERM sorting domain-containing protein [Pirellulales bacterium]|nr:PEP-CTERM sorting domain-containing protein [Pirellulales bacterium]